MKNKVMEKLLDFFAEDEEREEVRGIFTALLYAIVIGALILLFGLA